MFSQFFFQSIDNETLYLFVLILLALTVICLIIFIIFYKRKSKKEIRKLKQSKSVEEFHDIIFLYESRIKEKGEIKESFSSREVVNVGIDFLTNGRKIVYIGSGGFLSDPLINKDWSEALIGFLNRNDTELIRVIDLPEMTVNFDNELKFKKVNNFSFGRLEANYLFRFIKWICLQYHSLLEYKNIKIINSRGAPLFGHGIVIMIKDDSEVLLFSTNENTKVGFKIYDSKLAKRILKNTSDIIEIGTIINLEKLDKLFFQNDPRLEEVKKRIKKKKKKKLDKNDLNYIEKVSAKISEF